MYGKAQLQITLTFDINYTILNTWQTNHGFEKKYLDKNEL